MEYLFVIGAVFFALAVGSLLGYFARRTIAKKQVGTVEAKLNNLISQAKNEARETLFNAKEKAAQILEEAEKAERERRIQLSKAEDRLSKREQDIEKSQSQLNKKKGDLKNRAQEISKLREELETIQQQQIEQLEKTAQLTQTEAKEELLHKAEEEHKQELFDKIKKLETEQQEELGKKAQSILASAIQRYAGSVASEVTTTTVSLPSDELKGRVIGKEGRNIKALEKLTGVEVLVDDTPGAIVVSSFDPIRRQTAKLALDKLLLDGRIQPARIEEAVVKATEEIHSKIQEAGQATVYDVGVAGLDPRLVNLLGRLRFRVSYGQNVLLHSVEVAHLAGAIASEIGADVNIAKKAGLLHDIGKAVDHEVQGSHVEIGRNILKKFNIDERVITAMQSHHEEYPFLTLESIIVQSADAISGARPGARKDTLEAYLKRLEELEAVANSFSGIEKSYAIQAGREIRVFVKPEEIDDYQAHQLAKQIAQRVQNDLKYPGEIKVSVIREKKVIEYAK